MSSLASANGPSTTLRRPPATATRARAPSGFSPSDAISTPALVMSSLNFMYAASSLMSEGSSGGDLPSPLGPAVIRNRMVVSPHREDERGPAGSTQSSRISALGGQVP